MAVTSAIVMFSVIWWLTLLCILPMGTRSQSEAGEIVPGTPPSAPADPRIGRTMIWTTLVTIVVWSILYYGVTQSGWSLREWAQPPDYTQPRESLRPAAAANAPAGAGEAAPTQP